ncbi:MAG: four helix bundle protein [Prochlorotrichaceae cyanobacterium]
MTRTLAQQLLRSGTSIGANIEESQAAESTADFIHKLSISLKEARETRYWLLLLSESELVKNSRLQPLLNELEEVIKIIISLIVSKKRNK